MLHHPPGLHRANPARTQHSSLTYALFLTPVRPSDLRISRFPRERKQGKNTLAMHVACPIIESSREREREETPRFFSSALSSKSTPRTLFLNYPFLDFRRQPLPFTDDDETTITNNSKQPTRSANRLHERTNGSRPGWRGRGVITTAIHSGILRENDIGSSLVVESLCRWRETAVIAS